MPLFIVMLLLQATLVIHALKTGRDTKWIWIIVAVPGIGSLAYLVIELGPEILGSGQGRQASKRVMEKLNPNKGINEASLEYERSATVANSTRLAEECMAKERYAEASKLYRQCLTGMTENDPNILFGLAQSEYGAQNYQEVKTALDTLIEKNPDFKNQDAHLLFAKNLHKMGDTKTAMEEYEVLVSYYTGPEPTYRYAMLLKEQGQQPKAKQLLQSILTRVDLSPRHYKNLHKKWIDLARKELD